MTGTRYDLYRKMKITHGGPRAMSSDSGEKITIEHKGYTPVQCDRPLPCPFCGSEPELAQLAHVTRLERIGRSRKYREVRTCIVASSGTLTADTFWFKCPSCRTTTGLHQSTAQDAVEIWNRRAP